MLLKNKKNPISKPEKDSYKHKSALCEIIDFSFNLIKYLVIFLSILYYSQNIKKIQPIDLYFIKIFLPWSIIYYCFI